MLAFKIMNDPFVGSLTFCRIYSGKLTKGISLDNTVKEKRERIGRMLQMHSNSREDIEEAFAGDIVALAGLKETTTGDTLCDPLKPVILERMEFPEPVIRSRSSRRPRPTRKRWASRSIVLLLKILHSASRRTKNPARRSSPAWANFISTFSLTACVASSRSRQMSVARRLPTVNRSPARPKSTTRTRSSPVVRVSSPASRSSSSRIDGDDFIFESKIVGGAIPKEYIPGVQKGIESVMGAGPLAGFPMLGVKATLIDGAYHDVDSSVLAFEIAARAAFREGAQKAGAQLLEPIMKVEVVTPEDYVGDVIGDLNSRRGQISGTEARGIATVVNANVPLANMFGYVNNLRSMSQGRAQYTMQFDHYEPVPTAVAQEIQKKFA